MLSTILNKKLLSGLLIVSILGISLAYFIYADNRFKVENSNQPVKIIQIGFNKCGTTTLSDFLNANNIKSVHYDFGKLASTIWDNYLQQRPLLKGYDDYVGIFDMQNIHTDPPIFIAQRLFKELDRQYPGSKFILNTRDKNAWIKSRTNHPTKYGISYLELNMQKFNMSAEQVVTMWSNEWDKQHKEVLEYFKDRPNDLLVFNIETDHPQKIRQFLSKYYSIDVNLYAHKNKTSEIKRQSKQVKNEKL